MNQYNRRRGCFEAPINVNFELTERCNLLCPYCFKKFGCAHELPFGTLSRLLEEIAQIGTIGIQFSGGEPLLYKRLCEAIALAHNLGLETRISTSGVGLDHEMAHKIKKAGLNYCHISLNGSTEKIHSKTRDAFASTVKAIQVLKDEKVKCVINWVATHDNTSDLPNMVKLARKLRVIRIDVLMEKPTNQGKLLSPCTFDDLQYIAQLYRKNPDLLNVENCFIQLRTLTEANQISLIDKGCLAGRFHMAVNAQGEFLPCPHFESLGTNSQSIKEYWENDREINELREVFLKGNNIKNCEGCRFQRFCNPCRFYQHQWNKEITAIEYCKCYNSTKEGIECV